MVAFIFTTLIGIGGVVGALLYGRRRPVGAPLSWGEAMAAAVFAFFMLFWWYAVIPHQWLLWADTDLGWTTTKLLLEPTGVQPLTVNFQHVRDVIAVVIYGVGLGLQLLVWAAWQDRGKERPTLVPTSRYGRPLVKRD